MWISSGWYTHVGTCAKKWGENPYFPRDFLGYACSEGLENFEICAATPPPPPPQDRDNFEISPLYFEISLLKYLENRSKVWKTSNFFRVGIVMLKNMGHIGYIYTFSWGLFFMFIFGHVENFLILCS